MNGLKKTLVGVTSVLLGLAVAIPQALAVPMLQISSGATTITITDQDFSAATATTSPDNIFLTSDPGAVSWGGSIGNFFISFSAGTSKPILGTSNSPSMHLNSLQISGSGPGTVTVKFTDTDFTLPLSSGLNSFLSLIGGVTSGSVDSFRTYFDDTNAAFGTGTQLASLGPFAGSLGNPTAFATGFNSSTLPINSPYSLTMIAQITHNTGGVATSIDSHVIANPEPATIILFGSGLIGLGVWRLRKSQT